MAHSKTSKHLLKKYSRIREEYLVLKKEGYAPSNIYKRLSEKFFVAEITAENIVWKRGIYADVLPDEVVLPRPDPNPNQMNIMDVIGN
jgi:hypothetical protein